MTTQIHRRHLPWRVFWVPLIGWAFGSVLIYLGTFIFPLASLFYDVFGYRTGGHIILSLVLLVPGVCLTAAALIGIAEWWGWWDVALLGMLALSAPLTLDALFQQPQRFDVLQNISALIVGAAFGALMAWRQRRAGWLACASLGVIWALGVSWAMPNIGYGSHPLGMIPVQAVVGLLTGLMLMGGLLLIPPRPEAEPATEAEAVSREDEPDPGIEAMVITSDGELLAPVALPPVRPVEKHKRGGARPERRWLPIFAALFVGAFVSATLLSGWGINASTHNYRPTPAYTPPAQTVANARPTSAADAISRALIPLSEMTDHCRALIASSEPMFAHPVSVDGQVNGIALYAGDYASLSAAERNELATRGPCHVLRLTDEFRYHMMDLVPDSSQIVMLAQVSGARNRELVMIDLTTATVTSLIEAREISPLSPDGTHLIALEARGDSIRVSAINDAGNVIRILGTIDDVPKVHFEAWSPDGVHFSLIGGLSRTDPHSAVYIARWDQHGIQALGPMPHKTIFHGGEEYAGQSPWWSPDGRYYLAVGLQENGQYYLRTYDTAERALYQTHLSPHHIFCQSWTVSEGDQSPTIWFYTSQAASDQALTYGAWTVSPDGGDATYHGELVPNAPCVWPPPLIGS